MNGNNGYSGNDITPEILNYSELCTGNCRIEPQLYIEHKVNRGLRDLNGKGVLTGLTEISEIVSKKTVNGEEVPCRGKLYYRGYDVEQLVAGFIKDGRFGFEEIVYLLLFGQLPKKEQLTDFCALLSSYRTLPGSFVRDIIMKAPSANMMNSLARSVLTLYSYDANAEDTSVPNVLRQCLQLIARFPLLSVYGYHSYDYYLRGSNSFFIHEPRAELSKYAPKMLSTKIDVDKISEVIGKGGKVIQKICADCNVKIDVEEDGSVYISAIDLDDCKRALSIVETIAKDPEIGAIYKGKVTRLMSFGAFVEIAPGKEGLVHISQLDVKRVESVESVVQVGDEVIVKVTEIDDQGRLNLSRREALIEVEGAVPENDIDDSRPPRRGGAPRRQGGHDSRHRR